MSWRDKAKRAAATKAAEHVETGSIVGLGSGSTVAYALQDIGRRILEGKLQILGVPTSHQAFLLAVKHKIPITTLDEHPVLDLALDGADQVDEELNMIKGLGGAFTREKIVASAAKTLVIAIDETKLSNHLGSLPVPVEVLPFALATVRRGLQSLGGKPVLREAEKKVGPVVTDSGNFILDVQFGSISNPKELNQELKSVPGIIETGLFADMADVIYVGGKSSVRRLER